MTEFSELSRFAVAYGAEKSAKLLQVANSG